MKLRKIIGYMVLLVLFLPVLVLSAMQGASGAENDVIISIIDTCKTVRYEADVLFPDTTYYFNLVSVAENIETSERYINSGYWCEAGGARADSFTVSVLNRANHVQTVETELDTTAFDACGAGVTLRGGGETAIPAVEKTDGKTVAYESVTEAVFGRFPDLNAYKGVKSIGATVRLKHN